jgi:acetyl-CoA C-acetyltransferase
VGDVVLARDEHIRADTTVGSLGKLKPAFAGLGEKLGFDVVAQLRYPHVESIQHLHTAGNSSGIVDGAAAVLVGGNEFAAASGLKPRARVRAFASIGSEPAIMLTGPALVTEKLLGRAGMKITDIDLFEINEAFAAVALRFMRHFDLPADRVNVNGGAIAMGHPLGATGAMILGTVLDELERRDLRTALVTLCVGAGMGTATVIERV